MFHTVVQRTTGVFVGTMSECTRYIRRHSLEAQIVPGNCFGPTALHSALVRGWLADPHQLLCATSREQWEFRRSHIENEWLEIKAQVVQDEYEFYMPTAVCALGANQAKLTFPREGDVVRGHCEVSQGTAEMFYYYQDAWWCLVWCNGRRVSEVYTSKVGETGLGLKISRAKEIWVTTGQIDSNREMIEKIISTSR